jgi:hypothetical protein
VLHGARPVKLDFDKFVCAKDFGWRPISFDFRLPSGLLAEFYATPRDMDFKNLKHHNHLLFERWRGLTAAQRRARGAAALRGDRFESLRGYTAALWRWARSRGYRSFADLRAAFLQEAAAVARCYPTEPVAVCPARSGRRAAGRCRASAGESSRTTTAAAGHVTSSAREAWLDPRPRNLMRGPLFWRRVPGPGVNAGARLSNTTEYARTRWRPDKMKRAEPEKDQGGACGTEPQEGGASLIVPVSYCM